MQLFPLSLEHPPNSPFSRQIAFLKMYATRTGQETARDAVQIFGGRGITRTGMGRFIEHYHRTITFDSLLGGAEGMSISL
jgi:alkylation response protein AidB-like acyl-CoA dehydrogenase